MPLRTVAIIGAVCLTLGWLLASTLAPPVARVQSRPQRAAAAPALAPPTPVTEQLRLRSAPAIAAPTPERNPFTFVEARRSQPESVAAAPETAAAFAAALPPRPMWTLAGIGVSGEVRTAVLTDGTSVRVVEAGDEIAGYHVSEVAATAVVLVDASGRTSILRLP